jgi:hypothetical protein
MYGDGARVVVMESRDWGKTWQETHRLPREKGKDAAYSYSASNLAITGDRLTISGFRFKREVPGQPFFNEKTGGLLDFESLFFESMDGGRTWKGPIIVKPPAGVRLIIYESIHALEDGDWVVSGEHYKSYHDAKPFNPRVILLFSKDKGRTWKEKVEAVGGADAKKAFWHARLARLSDGTWISLPWTGSRLAKKNLPLHVIRGSRDGRRWTKPVATKIEGQTNMPIDLGDGRLGLVYSCRNADKPGIFFVMSRDFGKTWDIENQVQVWDAYGKDSIGVPRTDKYPSSHDNIGFGAPYVVQLSNKDILCGYWAVARNQFVANWARLRLDT